MALVLSIIYFSLLVINFVSSFRKRSNKVLLVVSLLFVTILICGHKYIGNGDSLDLYYYERDYAKLNSESKDFITYYLFFFTQIICSRIGMDYFQWWFLMSLLSIVLIIMVTKKFGYNAHVVTTFFMFYIIALYTGLKYYYGLCFFFAALSHFIRNKKGDLLRFILFTVIAGGFHALFYLFLVLLIAKINLKKLKYLFIIAIIVFGFAFVFRERVQEMISAIFLQILSKFNSTKGSFFMDMTRYGFLIPLLLHLVTLFYSFVVYRLSKKENHCVLQKRTEILLKINLSCVIFYPLFLFAVTYSRLLTIISFITICASSFEFYKNSRKFKQKFFLTSVPVVLAFSVYFFAVCKYFDYNLVPLFELYYIG